MGAFLFGLLAGAYDRKRGLESDAREQAQKRGQNADAPGGHCIAKMIYFHFLSPSNMEQAALTHVCYVQKVTNAGRLTDQSEWNEKQSRKRGKVEKPKIAAIQQQSNRIYTHTHAGSKEDGTNQQWQRFSSTSNAQLSSCFATHALLQAFRHWRHRL